MSKTQTRTATQVQDSPDVTHAHTLSNVSLQQKQKILAQLRRYLHLKDSSLTKITCKCSTQGSKVSISITSPRKEGHDSVRKLIRSSQFNYSEQTIVKMFERVCLAVEKMHQADVPHCAISADRVYLEGNVLQLDVPAFTLIEKAKRKQAKQMQSPPNIPAMTYEQFDVWSLAFLLIEMITKFTSEQIDTGMHQLTQFVSSIKNQSFRCLLEGMLGLKHRRMAVGEVVKSLRAKQMNPEVVEGSKGSVKVELFQEILLLPMFLPRNSTKQLIQSNNSHQVVVKESEHFKISIHWVKDSTTLHFEFLSKTHNKIMANLILGSQNLSEKAKQTFQDVGGLFHKLKEESTSLRVSSSAELTITFKPTKKVEQLRSKHSNAVFQHARAIKASQEMRKREEEVRLLVIIMQSEGNLGKKHQLRAVQELIEKSRCLPETSEVLKPVKKMWRQLFYPILNGENVQDLLTVIKICEKYWLECDEMMNYMRQRLGKLLGVGLWMLEQ